MTDRNEANAGLEDWSWYRIVTEGDEVDWYFAASREDAASDYEAECVDPWAPHTHIHSIQVVTEDEVKQERGYLDDWS